MIFGHFETNWMGKFAQFNRKFGCSENHRKCVLAFFIVFLCIDFVSVFFFLCVCFFVFFCFFNVSILHLSTNFQFPNFVFNPKICRSFQVFPRLFQHVSTNYLLQIQPISTHESSMIVNHHYIPSKLACVLIKIIIFPGQILIFPSYIPYWSPSFPVKSHFLPNHHLS
jgi:hypothetical protein